MGPRSRRGGLGEPKAGVKAEDPLGDFFFEQIWSGEDLEDLDLFGFWI